MPRLCFRISMSLDGFVAGPEQSVKNPLGIGGMKLHEWIFPLRAWRDRQGLEGGEEDESNTIVEEQLSNVGATIMGRHMFGGHPGPWDPKHPWKGWWNDDPPFHHPVFVVTHYEREPLEMKGGTTFYFVTDGIESALVQARDAAKDGDVVLAGGARAAQQYLAAGHVDQMDIHIVPVLLGAGERLFSDVGENLHGLHLARTLPTRDVVHLRFTR